MLHRAPDGLRVRCSPRFPPLPPTQNSRPQSPLHQLLSPLLHTPRVAPQSARCPSSQRAVCASAAARRAASARTWRLLRSVLRSSVPLCAALRAHLSGPAAQPHSRCARRLRPEPRDPVGSAVANGPAGLAQRSGFLDGAIHFLRAKQNQAQEQSFAVWAHRAYRALFASGGPCHKEFYLSHSFSPSRNLPANPQPPILPRSAPSSAAATRLSAAASAPPSTRTRPCSASTTPPRAGSQGTSGAGPRSGSKTR